MGASRYGEDIVDLKQVKLLRLTICICDVIKQNESEFANIYFGI